MQAIQYPINHVFDCGCVHYDKLHYITRPKYDPDIPNYFGSDIAICSDGSQWPVNATDQQVRIRLTFKMHPQHGFCLHQNRLTTEEDGEFSRILSEHVCFVSFPSGKVLEDIGARPDYRDREAYEDWNKRTLWCTKSSKANDQKTDRAAKFCFDDRHVVLVGAGIPTYLTMLVGPTRAEQVMVKGIKNKHLLIWPRHGEPRVMKLHFHPHHILMYGGGTLLACMGPNEGCIIDLD